MSGARTALGLLTLSTSTLISSANLGCLGPDLGFGAAGGGGGEGPGTQSSTSTSSSSAGTGGAGTGGATTGTGGETSAGGGTTGTGGAGGTGGGPACDLPEDCPDPGAFCLLRTCDAGQCGTEPRAEGTSLPSQTTGDCRVEVCDGAGGEISVDDDADVLDDFNDCTADTCTAGVPANAPEPADTPCGGGGALVCDGAGQCVGCNDPGQCAGTDDDCKTRTWEGGVCGVDFTPSGTEVSTQAPGNCQLEVCDGAGNVTGTTDDGDLPFDGNECTDDLCSGGVPLHPNLETGAACGDGPSCTEPPAVGKIGDFCDGFGACVVQLPELCPAGPDCFVPSCEGDACGLSTAAVDTPCDLDGTLDGFCDGLGACVECTGDAQCTGTETCDLGTGTCVATEKIVFVTSSAFFPTFGGAIGGDSVCQGVASGAGLSGTFRAWLSDGTTSPAARFTREEIPYRMLDGRTVASGWTELTSGNLQNGIEITELGTVLFGGEVWTGTVFTGEANGDDCSDWSTTAGTGFVGLSGFPTAEWTTVYSQFCDRNNVRLYCFEQ